MKACKTIFEGKVQSYYLICRNFNHKYQAVAIPWQRVDSREAETPEEIFNLIKTTVAKRGWTTEYCSIDMLEKDVMEEK